MKILVIGSPGAGKTEFTNRLANFLELPAFHLDDFYWLKDWNRPSRESWISKLNSLLKKEQWIIDGNYFDTLDMRLSAANFVIYLDYPIILCIFRAFKRTLIRKFVSRDSLPLAVREDSDYMPNIKLNLRFIKLICMFKIRYKTKILKLLKGHNIHYIILTSPKETNLYLGMNFFDRNLYRE
jgi:GTPase SAR1 family protein